VLASTVLTPRPHGLSLIEPAPAKISTLSLHDALPIFSSVKAVADTVKGILREDVEGRPFTPYGKSKLEAEQYLLAQTLPEDKRRSEEHTSELQSRENLVCRLLLEKKNTIRHRRRQS